MRSICVSTKFCEEPVTFFTSLKPNEGRVGEIQARALENWRLRMPGCEIVTFEGEPPLFGEIVRRAMAGSSDVVAYANADILFSPAIATVVEWCEAQTEDFLVVGRRTDELEGGQREVHRPSGMDYFIFRKGMFQDLPETRVGRAYYDSALLAHCLRKGIRVIDATEVIEAVHQWHDYAHVAGGRKEVFEGEEAQANKRNNGLRDFGPHIADVRFKLESRVGAGERTPRLVVRRKRVAFLRRMGLWGTWNRLTRGGLGFWGIHEYVGRKGCRYLTRSKIECWSPNSNVRQRFKQVVDAPKGVWTGFDFPCMWHALCARKKGSGTGDWEWTLFLWDPPSLGHRDRFPPLRWAIDAVFRWFARRCDRLVLNIHPGLLEEIGFCREEVERWRKSGKLELRMQDAFDGLSVEVAKTGGVRTFEFDFGVLSNWTEAKGGPFMAEALRQMPGKSCLWIGDPPKDGPGQIRFAGRLELARASEELKKCRVLVAPYLPVRSLKWNYVLKLFEYLQLGRPVLASDNPGNVRVAEKYPGHIVLFRSGDVRDFVEKAMSLD